MPSGKFSVVSSLKNWLSAGLLALGACTAAPVDQGESSYEHDPLEGYNRAMYEFNHTFDGVLLRPVSMIYRGVVPERGREMVSNAIVNIYSPVVFFNSVLQLDADNSFSTFWRFFFNSTLGFGGALDVASEMGLKNRPADFGQTLAIYGAGPGDYVVLPVIGPSNARDMFGRIGDIFMNPVTYMGNGESMVLWSATAVDKRSNNMKILDDIYQSSLDPYATFRSGYAQKRASDIRRAREARAKSLAKDGFSR